MRWFGLDQRFFDGIDEDATSLVRVGIAIGDCCGIYRQKEVSWV